MSRLLSIKEMERAVQGRDASYDGVFFVAVRTTRIFCVPSCPARKPLPRNCTYFRTAAEAQKAGYRPCKRCRPLDADGRPPEWVAHLLAAVDRSPGNRLTDADLRSLAVDPARVRRYFHKHYGMTFHAYCRGRRMGEALQEIRNGANLDDVVLDNGYESHSGFRDAFVRTFGGPPGKSRGSGLLVTERIESPVGPLLLGATDQGICLLEFNDPRMRGSQLAALRKRFGCAVVPGRHDHLERLKDELTRYFAGTLTAFQVPLVYPGTPFQEAVWKGLLQIPHGETRSYEDLAGAVGAPGAQRAVGRANGTNRVAIVIPCHRVVNKSGQLGGYGGGLWRKQFLLDLERRVKTDQSRFGSSGFQRGAMPT
jgi:AraC family transcriptional regulator, regulatory protein of adaptative response / methylated-DNA-[protein]-cysteine methyltransferase